MGGCHGVHAFDLPEQHPQAGHMVDTTIQQEATGELARPSPVRLQVVAPYWQLQREIAEQGLSNSPGPDGLGCCLEGGLIAPVLPHHPHLVRKGLALGKQGLGFGKRRRNRLLAEDVLAGSQGLGHDRGQHGDRQDDIDSIHILSGQDRLQVRVDVHRIGHEVGQPLGGCMGTAIDSDDLQRITQLQ